MSLGGPSFRGKGVDVDDQRASGNPRDSSEGRIEHMAFNVAQRQCSPRSSGSSVEVAITLTGLPLDLRHTYST